MVSCVNDVSDYIHVQREIAHRAVGYSAKNWLRHDVVGALLLGLHRALVSVFWPRWSGWVGVREVLRLLTLSSTLSPLSGWGQLVPSPSTTVLYLKQRQHTAGTEA